jgi:diguanylate cyclase (GGDEF)-like protein
VRKQAYQKKGFYMTVSMNEKIRFLRQQRGWSQEEIATMLDMSSNGYGCIERGDTDVNLSRIKQIAAIFGVDVVELFNGFNSGGHSITISNQGTQYNQSNCSFGVFTTTQPSPIAFESQGTFELLDKILQEFSVDSLTGLHNRRMFLERLSEEIARVKCFGGSALLFRLNFNLSKQVNKSEYDALLRRFSEAMRENLREVDCCARLSDAKFSILLPNVDEVIAPKMIEQLCSPLAEIAQIENVNLDTGTTLISADDTDGEAVLRRADDALHNQCSYDN